MKKLFIIALFGLVSLNYGCSPAGESSAQKVVPVESEAPAFSTDRSQKVLEHHLATFGANDLAGIMEDYSEESVLITPDSTFTGKAQIEGFFSGLLPAFPTEGTDFTLDQTVVDDELAYIVWHATTPSLEVPLGTDTYIIMNDKIVKQTFAGVINPVEN